MAGLLPAIVERFSKQYPRVRLHVELVQTALLQFQELRERRIDLLIGRIPQASDCSIRAHGQALCQSQMFTLPLEACRTRNHKIHPQKIIAAEGRPVHHVYQHTRGSRAGTHFRRAAALR